VLPSWAGRVAKSAAAFAVLTVLIICCGAGGILLEWHPIGGPAQPGPQGAGTLPALVGAPSPWTPDAATAPIGAASVLYTSNTWFPDESGWLAGLVGRADDTYRVAEWYGAAGMSAVLSPDGGRLAFDVSAVSGAPRQRCVTAGSLWLGFTAVSARRRRRWLTAGSLWLGVTAVSAALRQRCVTAGSLWLGFTAVSARRRQRCATAGSSRLGVTAVSAASRQRCVTAGG
jgi:hypothetical protein